MTPKEAATVINCGVAHVRSLVRSGKLRAKKLPIEGGGYYYEINSKDVAAYANRPVTRGRPRGKKSNA